MTTDAKKKEISSRSGENSGVLGIRLNPVFYCQDRYILR